MINWCEHTSEGANAFSIREFLITSKKWVNFSKWIETSIQGQLFYDQALGTFILLTVIFAGLVTDYEQIYFI